jgi:hypothetical protein
MVGASEFDTILRNRKALLTRSANTPLLGVVAGTLLLATPLRAQDAPPEWTADAARAELEATFAALDDDQRFDAAEARLQTAFDEAVDHAKGRDRNVIGDVGAALRMVTQIKDLRASDRETVYPVLRANPDLAATLAYLIREPHDDPPRVYRVLTRLCQARPKDVGRYPALVAAICVVHDDTFSTGATGPLTDKPNAIRVFEHLVSRRSQLVFDLNDLPAELLVHMVDTGVGQGEVDWAFDKNAGDRNVGKRYHDVPYDTRYFKMGADKRIASHTYTLDNIRRHGGVCSDQAYYASTIGKAIGVPTVMVSGRASEVGHCWVGFVRDRGGRLSWDFEEGRYDDFEDVRGRVKDPQTGRTISDDEIAMRADLAQTPPEDRLLARALLDEAERRRDPAARLDLLEEAARLCPANIDVWRAAAGVAGEMSATDRRRWAEALDGYCGTRYPTFTMTILRPLIESVPDAREQTRLWSWAHTRFSRQDDLACEILISQASMWERDGSKAKAYDGYVHAGTRYINDSSEALDALKRAETMLTRNKRPELVLGLYADAWRRVKRPSQVSDTFIRGTNWYRIGTRYAMELQKAGRESEAQGVLKRIGTIE